MESEVRLIPLDQLKVSAINVRKEDPNDKIEELAKSIQEFGLLQPILLLGEYGKPPYEVIVGQRRFLAHQYLNRAEIEAVFINKRIDKYDAIVLSLAENMQRIELHHSDKLNAITKLYLHFNKDVKIVAKKLGVSKVTIYDYLQISEAATDKAKDLLKRRKISKEDVKRVIRIAKGDKKKADEIIDKMSDLTKFQKERIVDLSDENPTLTANKLIENTSKAKISKSLVLSISKELEKAMDKAKVKLSMDHESIAMLALKEWLANKGFIENEE